MNKSLTREEKEIVLRVASLIEKGSEGMEQITGHYLASDGAGCCAMGAFFRALGKVTPSNLIECSAEDALESLGATVKSWPRIAYPESFMEPFGTGNLQTASIIDVVIFLNDRLGWSFSRIVEWLRDATIDKPMTIGIKE